MKIKILLLVLGLLLTSAVGAFGYKTFTEKFEITPKEKVLGEQKIESTPEITPTPTPLPTTPTSTLKPRSRIIPSPTLLPTPSLISPPMPSPVPTQQYGPTTCQQQISELMGRIYGDFLRIREIGQYFGPHEEQMRQGWLVDIEKTRNEVWARMASCPGSQEYYDIFIRKFNEEGIPFP